MHGSLLVISGELCSMRLDLMHAGYERSSADSDLVSSAGNSEGNAVIQMRDVFFLNCPFWGLRGTWSHACRLRDEARAKQQEVEALSAELTTVNAVVTTKGRALTAAQASIDALTHRALTAEGTLHTLMAGDGALHIYLSRFWTSGTCNNASS